MSLQEILSYGIVALVIIAIAMGMMIWRIYQSRKFVKDKLKCWFWPETGHKYYKFIEREVNGIEIKAPVGHKCPRYFYNREVVGHEMYPDSPPFGLKALQVEVDSVEWAENNPEPYSPHRQDKMVTSAFIDGIIDEGFVVYSAEQERIINELEKEVLKAKASRLNPMVVYVILVVCMCSAIAGAAISYQIVGAIKSIM